MQEHKIIVKAGLLLALLIVFQSIRLVIFLPPIISTIIIGTLVNATMLIAVWSVSLKAALIISIIAPVVAFLQGKLPLMPFILVVAAGNCMQVILLSKIGKFNKYLVILLAALCKTLILFFGTLMILNSFDLPFSVSQAIIFTMSWPQFVTVCLGGMLGLIIIKRLNINKT